MNSKKSKILILFSLIVFGISIFLAVIFYRANIERRLPKLETSEVNTALRGNIVTKDGFSVASSQKLYKAMVDTRNIDPDKKDMFIKLYSLYSGDNPKRVKKILDGAKGIVTLSYKIDAKGAAYLKELTRKLYRKKIFIPYEDPNTGVASLRGMSIVESGENRQYISKDSLTPVIGYVKKVEKDNITKVEGVKGVEKSYEYYISAIQDAKLIGPKDIGNNIILTSDSNLANRVDGYDTILSISLKFQTMLEKIIDEKKEFLNAKEIIVGVMDSKTGEMLALATTSRYDPSNIRKQDYKALNSSATEYAYEAGSVFKPFMFSVLLANNKINPLEMINTYNGKYQLGKRIIRDTHPEAYMTAEDIIVHSSNIGMIQIAQRLDGHQIYSGLLKFGFTQKTGIDMPYEQVGNMPPIVKMNSQIYKATISYGYGLQATFIQLLKAYNVFNNKGIMVTPKVVSSLYKNGKFYIVNKPEPVEVLTQDVAKRMKRILIKAVENGTGKKTKTAGLEIGGKTGTAHIASKDGGYANNYNGSFFGFVNDSEGNSYTIGVLAREPKKPYYYFGAQSALPVFKQTVDLMVDEGFLKPSDINRTNENIVKSATQKQKL
ncbi:peptidoglycan D,D-transpeptidase FtsI family protein [Campylobacter sp. RM16187]|uniref:peptidoglycan D,D-transpeptidase FtsI family protein n=1 Tax=Campylobacter sp. RM16187 TaxID=1660063 RepID=UPI0021B66AAE|nr:penicillin-binding protein 2 [Campylobacter sp. RM16187]QKG29617.1 cell division protein FtsI / penicillin-binding protein [Campylobacter sp. RM16187]